MAILSTLGSIMSGMMAMQQASYQAAIANRNAKIADMNATRQIEVGQIKAEDQDLQSKAQEADQLTAQAASGVTLSGDSQVLTRTSARALGRRDALNIIDDSNMRVYNFRNEAETQRENAQNAMMSGQASMLGSFLGAFSGLAGSMNIGGSSPGGLGAAVARPMTQPSLMTSYSSPLLRVSPAFRNGN